MLLASEPQSISPWWELISVALETTAFFFITLDLYGEERLRTLNRGFAHVLSRITFSNKNDDDVGTKFGFLFRLVFALILYGITRVLHGISAWSVLLLINVIVLFFDVIHFILAFGVWVLRKVQFTGLLLLIGTVISLASKAIPIVHALNELNGKLPFPP